MKSLFSISNKVALIMGVGLGKVFAVELAAAGASLACLDRDESAVSELVEAIRTTGEWPSPSLRMCPTRQPSAMR